MMVALSFISFLPDEEERPFRIPKRALVFRHCLCIAGQFSALPLITHHEIIDQEAAAAAQLRLQLLSGEAVASSCRLIEVVAGGRHCLMESGLDRARQGREKTIYSNNEQLSENASVHQFEMRYREEGVFLFIIDCRVAPFRTTP